MPEHARTASAAPAFLNARAAWEAGDVEGCLAACSAPCGDARVELLRARALLRLRQVPAALVALHARPGPTGTKLTAEHAMLVGTALVLSGDHPDGVATLRSAMSDETADPETRAEARLGVALAAFHAADYEGASQLLEGIAPEDDVVFVRALELRGWIHKRSGALTAALETFRAALDVLRGCRVFDRFVEANLVMVIGNLAVELLDFDAWVEIGRRAQHVRWEAPGVGFYRFWNELNRSMADELDGRPRDALLAARAAAEHAPSPALRVFAHCRQAAVLFAYGELLGYEDRTTAIRAELATLDLDALHEFEEINVCSVVAETLALIGDVRGADDAVRRIAHLGPEQRALLDDEPVKRAYMTYVEAVVADARGESFVARHRYRSAFRAFLDLGMTRRALLAALRIADFDGDPAAAAYVDQQVPRLPHGSWIREHAARASVWRTDAAFARLTRAEREVLTLLYEGLSTAEIAARRGRSSQTIRNTVSTLFKTFGVDTRQALIKECRRRSLPLRATASRSGPSASGDGRPG